MNVRPVGVAAAAGDPTPDLTLRQLVGQRMIYSYTGTEPPAALRARIARGEAAGVLLFAYNVRSRAALAATVRGLQAIRRPPSLSRPLLIMIDQEGGLVKRVSGAPSRSPAALGRIGSVARTRAEGRATAANLRSLGINVNLAPVADVGRPGSFQQRFQRSYSADHRRVAAMVAAFSAGLREGGVAATLKHFPGLGVVPRNEDDVVQRVSLPLATLRAVDELPFRSGIAAGAQLVMTSTAVYPALAPGPAMLSHAVTTTELREQLGFSGVSITDDISVSGLGRFGSVESLGLRSAQAGNDLLLYGGGYAEAARAHDSIVRAARAGRLDMRATRASVRRVLALRSTLPG